MKSLGYKIYTLSLGILIAIFCSAQDEHKLTAMDGAGLDQFGKSVAVWDTIVLIGCIADDDNGTNSGSAYIFKYNGSNYQQAQKLTANDGSAYDNFGVSVAIFDTIAMVGANLDDPKGNNSGAVYVYAFDGNNWIQQQKLSPLDGAAGDEFGFSVSLWKNLAVIGAYKDDVGNPQSGSVYIYRFNGSTWTEENKLNAYDNNADDFFGYDVDIHDSLVIVGSYLDDDNGTNSGSAYIYYYSGFGWQFEQKITASDGDVGDAFGFSVSLYDTIAAVGAYGHNANNQADGMVYVFTFNGSNWIESGHLTASDGDIDDWLSYSVDISGRTIVAGAFHDDDSGNESGAAYIFRYNGTQWIEELKLKASDGELGDQFGICVAISGFNVVIGSVNDDDNGTDAGAVYSYPLCTYNPEHPICAVTVDTSSSFVEVAWTKPITTFIDSYLIYRDTAENFTQIVAMDYSDNPIYDDMQINPNNGQVRYKMNTVNICGVKGIQTDTNQTIHLAAWQTGNDIELSWTPYLTPTPHYYRIWRDTTGTGNYQLIHATQNFEYTWIDPDAPTSQPLKYIIEAENDFGCPNGLDSAISNSVDPFVIGIADNTRPGSVHLFPNPAHDFIFIRGNFNGSINMNIIDLTGRIVLYAKVENETQTDVSMLNPGVYFYNIFLNKTDIFKGKLLID